MSFTGTSVADQVKARLSIPSDDTTTYSDTEIMDTINECVLLLAATATLNKKEVSISIGTSTRKYSLRSANMVKVDFAYVDGQTQILQPVSPEDIGLSGDISTTGVPTSYYEENGYIVLYPLPDASYTLYVTGSSFPTLLTAIGDSLDLEEWYKAVLKYYCLWRFCEREEMPQAASFQNQFNSFVESAITLERSRDKAKYAGEIREGSGYQTPGFIRNK